MNDTKFVPVMITPFNLKAKVDLDVVSRLVDFYLAAGVQGFFANCLSSEMYSITEDERLELTQHIVRYVNGRVPVVATGSFGLTINDKAEFTKLKVTGQEIASAEKQLDVRLIRAIKIAHGNISKFHEAQKVPVPQ